MTAIAADTPPVRSTIDYFKVSLLIAALATVVSFFVFGFAGAISMLSLSVIEISMSFDNAIVNAKILGNWPAFWQKAFLYFGVLFAAFGMRLLFPILVVYFTAGGPAVHDMLFHPGAKAVNVDGARPLITAFGGSFLLMISLGFFFDVAKEEHWVPKVENVCAFLGRYETFPVIATLGVLVLASFFAVAPAQQFAFMIAGVTGLMTFYAVEALGVGLGPDDETGQHIIRAGLGGFIYLEVLDSSFSFDGVIGAFAITSSILLIFLGNSVGAFFVRSMTIFAVDRGTLAEYRYLEHGANWSIAVLAALMFAKLKIMIPDYVTGLIGVAFIGAALMTSIQANRREAQA